MGLMMNEFQWSPSAKLQTFIKLEDIYGSFWDLWEGWGLFLPGMGLLGIKPADDYTEFIVHI
ncbi:MAG: hypothetical protein B6D61_13775, partial [Bacteroidetes bacterium 4484_249]